MEDIKVATFQFNSQFTKFQHFVKFMPLHHLIKIPPLEVDANPCDLLLKMIQTCQQNSQPAARRTPDGASRTAPPPPPPPQPIIPLGLLPTHLPLSQGNLPALIAVKPEDARAHMLQHPLLAQLGGIDPVSLFATLQNGGKGSFVIGNPAPFESTQRLQHPSPQQQQQPQQPPSLSNGFPMMSPISSPMKMHDSELLGNGSTDARTVSH